MTIATRLELAAIRVYKTWRYGKPTWCRYLPDCSSYGMEALKLHGFWRGNALLIRRISRCHPLGGWGYDPVPDR